MTEQPTAPDTSDDKPDEPRNRPGMYVALSATFNQAATIEQLGERHGPAGPLVIVVLIVMAKQQAAGGEVTTTARKLAAEAHLDSPEQARRIIADAAEVGTVEVREMDERTIRVYLTGWPRWQPRGRHALRMAFEREGQS